jgi:tRNA1Val (adenine37-N6)-methyltransferase
MPNSYFQFKQFTVFQDQCALKVCTDACILGAWFAGCPQVWGKVLDLGSGSGLLMLMLAQKIRVSIDGIELDEASYSQSVANVEASKWKSSIKVFLGDVRHFPFASRYDFIISNPPFFENSLPPATARANTAKHDLGLKFSELVKVLDENLTASGRFGLLLPYYRQREFENLANRQGFHLQQSLLLRQSEKHDYFRAVVEYARTSCATPVRSELTIQDAVGEYTVPFKKLMKDYYLYL